MPVGLMRTLRARVDLDKDGDNVVFHCFGGKSDLRTFQSPHTVIRADHFATSGWWPPRKDQQQMKKWMTVTVPLKIHTITKAGQLKTERKTSNVRRPTPFHTQRRT